jgi:hypothetical protein
MGSPEEVVRRFPPMWRRGLSGLGKPEEAGASGIALARSLRHIEEELAVARPRCQSAVIIMERRLSKSEEGV